jgi:hypothetical protein
MSQTPQGLIGIMENWNDGIVRKEEDRIQETNNQS